MGPYPATQTRRSASTPARGAAQRRDETAGDPRDEDHRQHHDQADEAVVGGDRGGNDAGAEQEREPEEIPGDGRGPAGEARDGEPGGEEPPGVDIRSEPHRCDARESRGEGRSVPRIAALGRNAHHREPHHPPTEPAQPWQAPPRATEEEKDRVANERAEHVRDRIQGESHHRGERDVAGEKNARRNAGPDGCPEEGENEHRGATRKMTGRLEELRRTGLLRVERDGGMEELEGAHKKAPTVTRERHTIKRGVNAPRSAQKSATGNVPAR